MYIYGHIIRMASFTQNKLCHEIVFSFKILQCVLNKKTTYLLHQKIAYEFLERSRVAQLVAGFLHIRLRKEPDGLLG